MPDQQPAPDPALGHACPHLERNDPRCQERFRVAELDAMYRYCIGGFYGCRLFHRINREDSVRALAERRAPAQPQQVTVRGRSARAPRNA
jgi:hypothetical protein